MLCCGKKNDVPAGTGGKITSTQNGLKAKKVFGADNTVVTTPIQGFRPIPTSSAGTYSKVTKAEDYGIENTTGTKSRMFNDETALNFNLDHDPGVANTFDIPTFDYQTMLSHNIYFNLNSKSTLNFDDGNRSVLRTNQPNKPVTGK